MAVRLPTDVAERLRLKPGDDLEVTVRSDFSFEAARKQEREEAIRAIRALQRPADPDYAFSREQANGRSEDW